MKTFIAAVAGVVLLAFGGVSHAGQISSPMIFGAGSQQSAECSIYNSSTAKVTVTVKIIDDFANTVSQSNCGGPINPGQFCSLFTPVSDEEAHTCVVTSPGSTTSLRASLVIYKRVFDPLFQLFYHQAIRSASLR